jgi:hypothetical protein
VSENARFATIEVVRSGTDTAVTERAHLDAAEDSAVDGFDFRALAKEPVRAAAPGSIFSPVFFIPSR